ncbi:MAG: carbon storage regulator CsrA [Aminobacteriaceae bacterium]
MLVLSRKPGEAIRIGDDIEISVVEVRGDTVRIGIDAPRSVPVFRRELIDQVQSANVDAAKVTADVAKLAELLKKK